MVAAQTPLAQETTAVLHSNPQQVEVVAVVTTFPPQPTTQAAMAAQPAQPPQQVVVELAAQQQAVTAQTDPTATLPGAVRVAVVAEAMEQAKLVTVATEVIPVAAVEEAAVV